MAEDGMNIKLRNLIIRDAYKERYLKEKALEKEKERKNRDEIMQRSAARFSGSPFRVNFIGLEEISELKRKHEKKPSKVKKSSKFKRKISETRDQKFLSKLRNEVRQIENSIFYLDEKKLEAALTEKKVLSTTYDLNSRARHKSKESESFHSRGGNLVDSSSFI
jgi:hypothetical protein